MNEGVFPKEIIAFTAIRDQHGIYACVYTHLKKYFCFFIAITNRRGVCIAKLLYKEKKNKAE